MPGYVIYCRKSSEAEDRQVLSIETQTREMKDLADKCQVPVDEIMTESMTAKEPGRPVFNKLMKRVYCGEAAGIICWKLDRLARNPVDGGSVIWAIKQHGIKVLTPAQTFSREDDNLILMYIEFGMAQKYVDDLSKNVKIGQKTKLHNGWYPGLAIIGYLNHTDKLSTENTIIKDPERFALVRRIWDLMLTGAYTPPQILELANNQWGFRSRRTRKTGGKPLSKSGIYKLFTQPFYYGEFEYPKGSGNWYEGKHEPMITRDEYDRVQAMLGRTGNPRPKVHHHFAYTGLIRCGDCLRMVTAEEKHQLICAQCRFKFAHRKRSACPRCETAIETMANPFFLHYIYYHCSKSKRPGCPQPCVTLTKLEEQIMQFLGGIDISEKFKSWAFKHLDKLHEQEAGQQKEIVQSQQKALKQCMAQLDGLVDLKTSAANRDGSLLTDQEYVERRGQLLQVKKAIEAQLNNADSQVDELLKRAKEIFEFACLVQERFKASGPDVKKEMLATSSSNLTLKDKKLLIEAKKPFFILGKTISLEAPIIPPIEPEKTIVTHGRNVPSIFMRPQMRGRGKDVRTSMRKAQRAAALIYAHFKKEFEMENEPKD